MKKQFKLSDGTILESNKRFKIITIDGGGGSMSAVEKEFGGEELEALEGYEGYFQRLTSLFKKGDDYYEKVGFDHFNGHFSGYKEGIYDVRFRKLSPQK